MVVLKIPIPKIYNHRLFTYFKINIFLSIMLCISGVRNVLYCDGIILYLDL